MTQSRADLQRYAWLSIAAALLTIALKTGAWYLTDSVGLLADAAESTVNLVAAIAALIALRVAAAPADDNHHFGHSKAEYFSAAVEGTMIFVAALFIVWQAVQRLLHPQPVEQIGIGLAISVLASVINGAVAMVLLRAGRAHRSVTLTADAKHLLTDVWTSVGVVVGVALVAVTGLQQLDPIVAILVGLNIIWQGWHLIDESALGLMDTAMSPEDNAGIAAVVARHRTDEVDFHGLHTRTAGHLSFAELHALVPGEWSVARGHDAVEALEESLREAYPDLRVIVHLEPREDPRSYGDYGDYEVPIVAEPSGEGATAADRR